MTGRSLGLTYGPTFVDWGDWSPSNAPVVDAGLAVVCAPWRATLSAYSFSGLFATGSGIELSGLTEIPNRPMYIACHHRLPCHGADDLVHFMLAGLWPHMSVALGHHMKWLERFPGLLGFFNGQVLPKSTEDRYLFVLNQPSMSVFVDGNGSQYPGDRNIGFRDGLFAASMATGRPILDVLFVEAGPSGGRSALDLVLWVPPNVPRFYGSSSEYVTWRLAHRESIAHWTFQCHADFQSRLGKLEAPRLACETSEGQCPAKPNKGHETNLRGAVCQMTVR